MQEFQLTAPINILPYSKIQFSDGTSVIVDGAQHFTIAQKLITEALSLGCAVVGPVLE